jgi:hypothetical protein
MASNTYEVNGKKYRRSTRQGRTPSGLGKSQKYRLYENDEKRLLIIKSNLGEYYNKNKIVRIAVKLYLDNFVPTELLNP